jgi:hypothetical protein
MPTLVNDGSRAGALVNQQIGENDYWPSRKLDRQDTSDTKRTLGWGEVVDRAAMGKQAEPHQQEVVCFHGTKTFGYG